MADYFTYDPRPAIEADPLGACRRLLRNPDVFDYEEDLAVRALVALTERLQAENKALREAIAAHKAFIGDAEENPSQADYEIWALVSANAGGADA